MDSTTTTGIGGRVGTRAHAIKLPQLAVMALPVAGLLALLAGIALNQRGLDLWGAVALPVILTGITAPIILGRERRREVDLGPLLLFGLIARFVSTYVRYLMEIGYYRSGDALTYHAIGSTTASQVWSGDLPIGKLFPSGTNTIFAQKLTGLLEMLTAQSAVGTFMLYSWLGFFGIWAFINAARRAIPNLHLRRYAVLVIFLPTMLFWSSAIGKDAWMVLWLGVFAAGAARLLTKARGGTTMVLVAGVLAGVCRPHVALLAIGALLITVVVGGMRSPDRPGGGGARRVVLVALLTIGLAVAFSALTAIFPTAQPLSDPGSIPGLVAGTQASTSIGGSQIESTSPNAVWAYPFAMASALYRPLLIEARNPPTLIAALEGTLLLVLTVRHRRNIVTGLRQLRTTPYLMFATLYGTMFFVVWSSISNLGILARQRVQGLPFLLLLLAMRTSEEETAEQRQQPASER
jgi:hypothetical protein